MTNLIPSISIANYLQQRDVVVEKIDAALDLLGEANDIAQRASLGDVGGLLQNMTYHREHALSSGAREYLRKALDAQGWRYLMTETGLKSFMDSKSRAQWEEQIQNCKTPPLTADNIAATFGNLYDQRGEMFDRGVIEVFRKLSWDYKTNTPNAFGQKIVLRCFLANYGPGWFPQLHSRTSDEIDDLMRVMHVLDGKPEPDHRWGTYAMFREARAEKADTVTGERMHAENEYLHFRWFKNGNAHVTFKRPDLVEKMNRILGKHYPRALPETRDDGNAKRRARRAAPAKPVTDLEFFATPAELAERMVVEADLPVAARVLEPSAGEGAIAAAALAIAGRVDCIEIDAARCAKLRNITYMGAVHQGDFLGFEARPVYDAVLMNPPFGQQYAHVSRAFEWLKPGGTLVAVMGASAKFHSTREANEFRELWAANSGTMEDLPPGTFKASGTMANTVLVTMRRAG